MKKKWLGIVIGVILSAVQTMPVWAEQATVRIGTAAELRAFAERVNGGDYGADAVLTADIDLDSQVWTPIGKDANECYTGTFDGNGYSIQGLKIESTNSYQALFKYSKGTVKNLTVYGEVTGANTVAGIVASLLGGGAIQNCGNYATVTAAGNNYAAGIAAQVQGGAILDCYNAGVIQGNIYTGGIAGKTASGTLNGETVNAQVVNCYNTGTIRSEKTNCGGIVGYALKTEIRNCYNSGRINTSAAFRGGLIGNKQSGTSIANCYYLDTSCAAGIGSYDMAPDTLTTPKTMEEMKEKVFIEELGIAYAENTNGQNNGFPILSWQKERNKKVIVTYEQGVIRAVASAGTEATVYAAAYRGNTLRSIHKTELISGTAAIQDSTLELTGADAIRVFVWEDGMTPACDTANFIITE